MQLLFLAVAIIICDYSESSSLPLLRDYDVVHVVNNHNTCSREEAAWWANDFVNCFSGKEYKRSPNLFNIVIRLLDHSKSCIKFATIECRPNYDGFVHIMGKVIQIIKEYTNMHVERLMNAGIISYDERTKIKDVDCVENSLTRDTYAICFNAVISTYDELLGVNETYDQVFQKEVEKSILCTNKANNQCSKSVKTELNRIVRYILGVKQPEKDDFESLQISPESSSFTELPKLSSEFQKTRKENGNNSPKLKDFIGSRNQPIATELLATEKEKGEDDSKIVNLTISIHSPSENNDDDQKIKIVQHFTEALTFALIYNESTTLTNLPETQTENIENHSKLSEDLEITENLLSASTKFPEPTELLKTSVFLNSRRKDNNVYLTELPISTLVSIQTKSPEVKNFLNNTTLDVSKATPFSEIKNNKMINILDSEEILSVSTKISSLSDLPKPITTTSPKIKDHPKISLSTEFSDIVKLLKSSTFSNLRKKDNNSHSTELPDSTMTLKIAELPEIKDFPNSTNLDISKDVTIEEMKQDTVTLDSKDIFPASTKFFDSTDQPKSIVMTSSPKLSDFPKTTMFTKLSESSDLPEITASTKRPILTDLPEITASTKRPVLTDLLNTTRSTGLPKPTPRPKDTISKKPPKSTDPTKTTTSIRPPRPTRRPKTTTFTKAPTSSRPVRTRSRQRNTYPDPPRPTEPPRSTSTRPPRPTRRPKTTTSTKASTSPRPVPTRPRQRNIYPDPPRPTEPPRPWYDFIIRPFVSLWRTVKSWFGF